MTRYRFIGSHPESLASGRPIEPGEFVDLEDDDLEDPHNKMLLDDGHLITVEEEGKKSSRSSKASDKEEES